MTKPKKRPRGRPAGVRFGIQKHIFMDDETAYMLRELAGSEPESAYVRELIRKEYKRRQRTVTP